MKPIEIIPGIIVAPDPVERGPAEWSYEIDALMPTGVRKRFSKVIPANERYDPEIYNSKSVKPGTAVFGIMQQGGEILWYIFEQRNTTDCEGES